MDTRVTSALTLAEVQLAPDARVTCFDVEAKRSNDGEVVLSGTVETDRVRDAVTATVRTTVDEPVQSDELHSIEAQAYEGTVTESEAAVYSAPNASSERVTSVLYGTEVTAFDTDGTWRRIRTPDGYLAWVDDTAVTSAGSLTVDGVVVADVSVDGAPGQLYAGTPCELQSESDETVTVQFRTGNQFTLATDVVQPTSGPVEVNRLVDHARRYLGTPYVWGGMTTNGIDCSGLVWQAYYQEGIRLPRDTDQQRKLGTDVSDEEYRVGDLLFFPGHVALSLGGDDYIHASGSAERVVINSFDPDSDRFAPDRAEDFDCAKRILSAPSERE